VGVRFSPPVQTGLGDHPASYTMSTRSFPVIKRPECDVDHPSASSAEVKERVELPLRALVACSMGEHFYRMNELFINVDCTMRFDT
jgi:hypothetical protein